MRRPRSAPFRHQSSLSPSFLSFLEKVGGAGTSAHAHSLPPRKSLLLPRRRYRNRRSRSAAVPLALVLRTWREGDWKRREGGREGLSPLLLLLLLLSLSFLVSLEVTQLQLRLVSVEFALVAWRTNQWSVACRVSSKRASVRRAVRRIHLTVK